MEREGGREGERKGERREGRRDKEGGVQTRPCLLSRPGVLLAMHLPREVGKVDF